MMALFYVACITAILGITCAWLAACRALDNQERRVEFPPLLPGADDSHVAAAEGDSPSKPLPRRRLLPERSDHMGDVTGVGGVGPSGPPTLDWDLIARGGTVKFK